VLFNPKRRKKRRKLRRLLNQLSKKNLKRIWTWEIFSVEKKLNIK